MLGGAREEMGGGRGTAMLVWLRTELGLRTARPRPSSELRACPASRFFRIEGVKTLQTALVFCFSGRSKHRRSLRNTARPGQEMKPGLGLPPAPRPAPPGPARPGQREPAWDIPPTGVWRAPNSPRPRKQNGMGLRSGSLKTCNRVKKYTKAVSYLCRWKGRRRTPEDPRATENKWTQLTP